ncbi:MAG TPA: lysine exporter LysO family protein [Candidatus Odoribacter faecigallinarum]|uniref:Lysine exporter LysO family protein n=1 Tax=Candidatus Odoribacter faecigallinarum TaxID=2838706 RepID=A0A9D1UYP4_9BACT|nr:lysine exporter LysO family protein [Candidatus Odoribacter faecigallinarum]
MRGSLIIVAFFIAGLLLARWGWIPSSLSEGDVSIWALYALMFLVGISIGSDTQALKAIRGQHWKILWVPVATWAGTLAGTALASLLLPSRNLADCLAVGSGFGYYSLSSIFITEYRGAELGTIALAANIIREIITLLGAPLLVCWFGKLAPICAGGATTMDTTLPVITRFSGKEFVVISIFHGFIVDFSVPFLVTFFCKL